ncbi:hypothetical protein BWI17_01070 [Betaproteobacteria bacterium GR16-43]|nr:hypothetical protein BWI17_01070 [Betaproteobacteria bacterium GR16-43]
MLKIHGVPISVHTRKVIVVALAKGIEHGVIPVVPVIPGNPPANWRELSPTGKIPAITDGDYTLVDSAAICAYLERRRPSPSLYPADPRDYGQALALEQYAGDNIFRGVVHPLFHEVFVHPKVRQIPTNPARIDEVLATTLPEVFGYLESRIAGDFLAGKSLSIADIAVASNLVTFQYIGFELERKRFPRLAAHFGRVCSTPAFALALERERGVVDSMQLRRDFLREAAA